MNPTNAKLLVKDVHKHLVGKLVECTLDWINENRNQNLVLCAIEKTIRYHAVTEEIRFYQPDDFKFEYDLDYDTIHYSIINSVDCGFENLEMCYELNNERQKRYGKLVNSLIEIIKANNVHR